MCINIHRTCGRTIIGMALWAIKNYDTKVLYIMIVKQTI